MLIAALRPHCGRERKDIRENTDHDGATEMLVIGGPESPIEVRGLAKYPSHGGSQGFKSPHLHPHNSAGHRSRRVRPAGPGLPPEAQRAANWQQPPRTTSPSGLAVRGKHG